MGWQKNIVKSDPLFFLYLSYLLCPLQLVLSHRLSICMEYVVEGCRVCPQWLQSDLLRALAALLYENVGNVVKVGVYRITGRLLSHFKKFVTLHQNSFWMTCHVIYVSDNYELEIN